MDQKNAYCDRSIASTGGIMFGIISVIVVALAFGWGCM
jgi:hypothetical protein